MKPNLNKLSLTKVTCCNAENPVTQANLTLKARVLLSGILSLHPLITPTLPLSHCPLSTTSTSRMFFLLLSSALPITTTAVILSSLQSLFILLLTPHSPLFPIPTSMVLCAHFFFFFCFYINPELHSRLSLNILSPQFPNPSCFLCIHSQFYHPKYMVPPSFSFSLNTFMLPSSSLLSLTIFFPQPSCVEHFLCIHILLTPPPDPWYPPLSLSLSQFGILSLNSYLVSYNLSSNALLLFPLPLSLHSPSAPCICLFFTPYLLHTALVSTLAHLHNTTCTIPFFLQYLQIPHHPTFLSFKFSSPHAFCSYSPT